MVKLCQDRQQFRLVGLEGIRLCPVEKDVADLHFIQQAAQVDKGFRFSVFFSLDFTQRLRCASSPLSD